jgi:2-isopropylmalate synthase
MVSILDTTLREGEQTPGVYFSEHVKLDIARQLNNVGVKFIEAGHPFVGQEIYDAVKHLAQQPFRSLVGAHSRSLRKDVDLALECGVKFLGIFYCVSDERLQTVFNTNLNSAINQITEVIEYAKSRNPELIVRFTPEDTVRSNFQNVIEAAVASVQAGADIISVADTTGFMVPRSEHNMYDFVKRLKDTLAKYDAYPAIAVHCHNDRGLALANALDGYFAGAEIIDASVLGLGERAGIVDLATLTAMLAQLENEHETWDLKQLVPLYQMVSKFAQVPIPVNFPITGENAFKHCAGVHTHAAQVNPLHYQSLDPAPFGRQMEIALDHMSGISSLRYALSKIGLEDLDKELMNMVLLRVKEVGRTGRTVALDELSMIVNWVKEKQKVEASTRKAVNFEG